MLKLLIMFLFFMPNISFAENIDFSADDGLVWDQKKQTISMNKNAIAKTQTYELKADNIIAHYKEPNKQIYKIFANDNVTITSPTEIILTDKMIYDIDKETINLFSINTPTTLTTPDSKVIAKEDIIYFKDKNYATAKNATILHSNRTLTADNIKVSFENINGKNQLKKIDGTGNIKLIDSEEELYGDTAHYNPQNGYATIEGNVKFKRGNQANLSGGQILYNMETGIAKILPKKEEGKVQGVFSTTTSSKK